MTIRYNAVVNMRSNFICTACGDAVPRNTPHMRELVEENPKRICRECAKAIGIWKHFIARDVAFGVDKRTALVRRGRKSYWNIGV